MKPARSRFLFPLSRFSHAKRVGISLLPIIILIIAMPVYPSFIVNTPIALYYPAVLLATWLGGSMSGFLALMISTTFIFGVIKPELFSEMYSDETLAVRFLMFYLSTGMVLTFVRLLEKALTNTETALKLRDEFLSTISHELKTPITAIRLQLEILKDQQKDAPAMNRILSIEKMVNRQDKLVASMLDLELIETGQIKLRKEECDLGLLINISSKLAQQSLDANDINIDCDKLVVNCDKSKMEQVVFNLVHNAIRFGDRKNVGVSLSTDDKNAIIKISNSGTEILDKDKTEIFQKMMRPLVPKQVQGLGLGLYLAKEFVELHGGSIEVSSTKQTGTTFTVRLPI